MRLDEVKGLPLGGPAGGTGPGMPRTARITARSPRVRRGGAGGEGR